MRSLNGTELAKYLVHGIAFSILYVLLALVWAFILVILVGFGSFLGLIVGIVLLILIVGLINSALGAYLWDIDTGGKGLVGMFVHGLVLFIILLVVGFAVSFSLNLVFPETPTLVVAFIIEAFLYGVIGKTVCTWFGRTIESIN